MYLRIYAVLCLLVTTFSFTIFIDSLGLSTDQTLQPNTLYTLLANINGNSVPSGSVVILKFSNRFSITGSTLNSCQFSNTGTNPVTSTSCSPSFDAGTATYSITFLSIYASGTTAQAFLLISVVFFLFSFALPILMEAQEQPKQYLCKYLIQA